MTTITHRTPQAMRQAATRAAGVRAEVRSETLPVNFEAAYAKLMMANAKSKAFRERNKPPAHTPPRHETPSAMQEQALLALKGVMLTTEIRDIMGVKEAAGFLSGLCAKGFVERRGAQSGVTKWRRTRKGCKWVERNRGAGK